MISFLLTRSYGESSKSDTSTVMLSTREFTMLVCMCKAHCVVVLLVNI